MDKIKEILELHYHPQPGEAYHAEYWEEKKDRVTSQLQALFDKRVEGIRKEKDIWWHDNIQRVKKLIREGKNPQEEKDSNLAHDHWHPELALLWEIAIEALKSKIKE